MVATLAAAFVYFLILIVTRLIGNILRAYLLAPMIGHGLTAALELPAVLLIAWVSSRLLIRAFGMRRDLTQAAVMGAVTFVLLIAGEMLLSITLGDSFVAVASSFARIQGVFGLIGALILAFFPAIQVALARSKRR